jgi:hypothetical protein
VRKHKVQEKKILKNINVEYKGSMKKEIPAGQSLSVIF